MALPDQEHERLLSLYRDRVASYMGVDDRFGAQWREWCRMLLSFGGSLVAPPRTPESDLTRLCASGSRIGSAVRFVDGDVGECHRNVAARWIEAEIDAIGTGYALSDDDLWRQHSWGVDATGTLVETTGPRCVYVGIVLSGGRRACSSPGATHPSISRRCYGAEALALPN